MTIKGKITINQIHICEIDTNSTIEGASAPSVLLASVEAVSPEYPCNDNVTVRGQSNEKNQKNH